ncbi:MAG: ABC transporter ATP-binding protein [Deltaproteobacteria bacterium]|nr:ABC transporter ATP-binding protein [Deltaproteobacteria bacterium]
MIRIEEIHKSFNGFPVLKGVSFEVKKGEILALIGGSGKGKSVILKHVVGLITPDQGHVYIDGKDIGHLKGKELEELRSRFGFLFQGGALFSSLTVFDNLAFPLREKTNLKEEEIRDRVLQELDQVGLAGAENKFPAELSGGMLKRTAFARALVTKPEIILFDEPTTGLDPVIAHTILDLVKSVHQHRGFTAIIVSHELSRLFQIAQKVAMLHEGVILTIGTPDEFLSSDNPVVRQFVSGSLEGPIKLY